MLTTVLVQVKRAYKNLKEVSQDDIAKLAPVKQSTFPSAQLTWVPRKRHNTRWPVPPPDMDAPLLAELQPLIKFELHPAQIDDPAFWEQHNPINLKELGSAPIQLDAQQVQKLSNRRLSIAKRPSLSTISEELKELSGFPIMTPGKTRNSFYSSPLKTWSVATDRYNTPTKVASSPLRNFTITATPTKMTLKDLNDVEEINEAGAAQTSPVRSATEGNETASASENNTLHGVFGCPSTPLQSRSPTTAVSNEKTDPVEIINQQGLVQFPSTPMSSRTTAPAAPIAVFDQPAPKLPTEPEYETRRRVSLDNARRSDRRSDAKALRRVRNWVTNTLAINRRHSISNTKQEKPRQNRRHTLDVDVGRNPDIFGQATRGTSEEVPSTEQEAPAEETGAKDAGLTVLEMVNRYEVQEQPSHEELMPQTEKSSAASREEDAQQPATPSSDIRKSTYIDWDPMKLVDERYNQCPRTGTISVSIANSNSSRVDAPTTDIPTIDATEAAGPTVDSSTSHSPKVEAPKIEATTADALMADAPTVDSHDDSELSLLRNFVRRAQMKPKRRSSATLFTGSPLAKADVASPPVQSPRMPLGEKDSNRSPSPSKKRKVKDAENVPLTAATKASRLVKPDLEDTMPQPQRKKRRKGVEMDSPDDILNPDIDFSQKLTQKGASGGLRRSKRVATSKPTELATPSQIPVRLPGSSGMMTDADMPAVSTAGLMQRKTEKDLATLTRTNTRRNKGGAVPVHVRLADMVDVADATTSDPFCSPAKPITATCGGKAVRWNEILFRTQGEEGEDAATLVVSVVEEEKDQEKGDNEDDAEEELQPPQMRTELGRPSNPIGEQLLSKQEGKLDAAPAASPAPTQSEPEKKKKALRPRASRLPAAKTMTAAKKNSGLPAATPRRKAAATTASSSLPGPPLISKAAARSTAGATPASKRTGVLGVSLGTPAPKRRGGSKK